MQIEELEAYLKGFPFEIKDELDITFSGLKIKLKLNIPKEKMGGYDYYSPVFINRQNDNPDLTIEVNYQRLTGEEQALWQKFNLPKQDLLCSIKRAWDLWFYESLNNNQTNYVFIIRGASRARKRSVIEGNKKRVFKLYRLVSADILALLNEPVRVAIFNEDLSYCKIWIQVKEDKFRDPFFPPLHYFFTVFYFALKGNGILMHGSAVEDEGKAYLFLGGSGRGKSTLANLWLKSNSGLVIHEDQVLVRMKPEGLFVSSLPFFNRPWLFRKKKYLPQFTALEYPLAKAFLLKHAGKNYLRSFKAQEALKLLLKHSLLPLWDKALFPKFYSLFLKLLEKVPLKELNFKPDADIIDFIKKA
jgi:hypothetical protein